MDKEIANRHYSEKGGHFKRGVFRKEQIKAIKTQEKMRRKGVEPVPVFTKLVGADVFIYERLASDSH